MLLVFEAGWAFSAYGSILTNLWTTLFFCCIGALLAVILGLVVRRSLFWWIASTLTIVAIVLSVGIAVLDKLGFK
jgi:hypothetical protein